MGVGTENCDAREGEGGGEGEVEEGVFGDGKGVEEERGQVEEGEEEVGLCITWLDGVVIAETPTAFISQLRTPPLSNRGPFSTRRYGFNV